jgi:hypothetical protein
MSDNPAYQELTAWPSSPFTGDKGLPTASNAGLGQIGSDSNCRVGYHPGVIAWWLESKCRVRPLLRLVRLPEKGLEPLRRTRRKQIPDHPPRVANGSANRRFKPLSHLYMFGFDNLEQFGGLPAAPWLHSISREATRRTLVDRTCPNDS